MVNKHHAIISHLGIIILSCYHTFEFRTESNDLKSGCYGYAYVWLWVNNKYIKRYTI